MLNEWMDVGAFESTKKVLLERERDLLVAVDHDVEQFLSAYRRYTPAIFTIWRADEPIAAAVAKRIRAKTSAEEANSLIEALNVPLQDNLYKQEEYELAMTDDLEAHAEKFKWIYSRYGERSEYTAEQAREKLGSMDGPAFLRRYEEEKQKVRDAVARAKALFAPSEVHLVDALQFILYYRTHRTDIMSMALNRFMPTLEAYAQMKDLTLKESLYCTADELLRQVPDKAVLRARIDKSAFGWQDGTFSVMTDEEADAIDQFFVEHVALTNEVHGQTACKGLVRGRVAILRSKADMANVKEGDVLVASMTNPNYLPAMKLAAAFVTDEGGVTCHAAIIAREMNKPCIIGTKIATQVLKDGDMVEVDAEKGIVRKIG